MLIASFIFVFAVVLVIYSSKQTSFSAKLNTPPDELDLNSVRDALTEKLGWGLERANAAREEYVRFLTLLQMKPGFMLVSWPNAEGQDDLDQFWHQHILDTAKYAIDCNRLFGRMIHHNPHLVRGSGEELGEWRRHSDCMHAPLALEVTGGRSMSCFLPAAVPVRR